MTDGTGKQTAPQTFHILIQDGAAAAQIGQDAIIADLSWTAPGSPATFGFTDIAISASLPDMAADWSNDLSTTESGDAALVAYLELNSRLDNAGEGNGSW